MSTLNNIDSYLDILEKSRSTRENTLIGNPTPEEKHAVLEKYHPDYIDEIFTTLPAGVNKGEKVVKKFAELVCSKSITDKIKIDKSISFQTDVLVIGGGGAGITAAIFAHDAGAKATLVTKLRLGDSNTIMAQGGIQVSIGKDDSPVQHFKDSMIAGGNTNDPKLLKIMVERGPEAVGWLEDIGVIFSTADDGD